MELLAPAGNLDIAYSAFYSGADAVYLAGKSFGARASAENFTNEEIKEITKFAHLRNKKIYVTVNTIIFEDEFDEVLKFLDFLYLADVDGVIVEDLGLASLIKDRYPSLELHASTQMNIHTVNDAKVLKDLGFKRVVVSREAPIEVIKEIIEKVKIEVEVFIHGAICVSYSGNCYLSSIIGKRSGNRGRCAQPCRLEYSLEKNGEIIDKEYLLSPKELCTIEYIDELKKINVTSLKIEGRLKRKEYVSETVLSYRRALDKVNFNLNKEMKNLKIAYNRGFTKGFLFNENNNYFNNSSFQNHQGILIGNVVSLYKDKVNIKLIDDLEIFDSIRIVGKVTDGVTINQMYVNNKLVKSAKKDDIVTIKVHEEGLGGAKVYLTSSNKQVEEVNNLVDKTKIKINGEFSIEDSLPTLRLSDGITTVKSQIDASFDKANNDMTSRITEQLSKLSSTIYELDKIVIKDKYVLMAVKDLNNLRREAVEKLNEARFIKYPNRVINNNKLKVEKVDTTNDLLIKVKTLDQLKVALMYDAKVFVEDKKLYEEYKYKGVLYATSRVFNNDKIEGLTESISAINNSYTSIYMNVVNSESVRVLNSLGAKCVGVSLEASNDDISDLVKGYINKYNTKPNLYMMVYGYYELMISKYCPIQKVEGIEKKNCNMCINNQYNLVDRMGYRFRIIKGEGCYTKILNSKRLHLLPKLEEIKKLGITNFLLDFSIESKEETKEIIEMYVNGLNGVSENIRIIDATYGHFNEGVL